jgi:hypothetical protein
LELVECLDLMIDREHVRIARRIRLEVVNRSTRHRQIAARERIVHARDPVRSGHVRKRITVTRPSLTAMAPTKPSLRLPLIELILRRFGTCRETETEKGYNHASHALRGMHPTSQQQVVVSTTCPPR